MKTKVEEQSDEYYKSMDPIYKLFLDHLRSDGTSYILEMDDRELGVPVYLKYEGQKTSSYNKVKTKSSKKTKRNESDNIAPLGEESYERFLKNLKFKEGLMILELEGGRNVIYEEDRKNMSENMTVGNGVSSDKQGLVLYTHASGSNVRCCFMNLSSLLPSLILVTYFMNNDSSGCFIIFSSVPVRSAVNGYLKLPD